MNHLDILLPAILLIIAFLLKLVVDRNVDVPNTIQAICELPVDILFLALSFVVGFTISSKENMSDGLLCCYVGIAIAVVVVVLWRKSIKLFLVGNKLWLLLFFINLSIAGYTINLSIDIITNKGMSSTSSSESNQPKK